MTKKIPSFSVIVETENLGMAGIEDLKKSLDSLKRQTLPITQAKEVIIVVGSHVPVEVQKILQSDYPWITLHPAHGPITYAGAKYEGAKAATSEVVVFVDSDMSYDKTWLSSLLTVYLTHPDAGVVASDTRVEIVSGYTLSLCLTWMIDVKPPITNVERAKTFNLNNFAIKRELILANPFPTLNLYRGHIAFWRRQLAQKGVTIYRIPHLQGYHAPPSNIRDYVYRMIIYGADFVATGDYHLYGSNVVYHPSIAKRLGNLFLWQLMKIKQFVLHTTRLLSEDLTIIRFYPLAVLISLFGFLLTLIGALIAVISPRYFYDKITAYEAGN